MFQCLSDERKRVYKVCDRTGKFSSEIGSCKEVQAKIGSQQDATTEPISTTDVPSMPQRVELSGAMRCFNLSSPGFPGGYNVPSDMEYQFFSRRCSGFRIEFSSFNIPSEDNRCNLQLSTWQSESD